MTFFIAFGLMLLCVIGLSIGRLVTGKNKFHCKRCGTPDKDCPHCKKKN